MHPASARRRVGQPGYFVSRCQGSNSRARQHLQIADNGSSSTCTNRFDGRAGTGQAIGRCRAPKSVFCRSLFYPLAHLSVKLVNRVKVKVWAKCPQATRSQIKSQFLERLSSGQEPNKLVQHSIARCVAAIGKIENAKG